MKTEILQSNKIKVLVYTSVNSECKPIKGLGEEEWCEVIYARSKSNALKIFQTIDIDVVVLEMPVFTKIKHKILECNNTAPAFIVLTNEDGQLITPLGDEQYIPFSECTTFTLKQLIINAAEKNLLLGENAAYKELIRASISRREARQRKKQEILPKLIELRSSIRQCIKD